MEKDLLGEADQELPLSVASGDVVAIGDCINLSEFWASLFLTKSAKRTDNTKFLMKKYTQLFGSPVTGSECSIVDSCCTVLRSAFTDNLLGQKSVE